MLPNRSLLVGIPPKYWRKEDEKGKLCLETQGFFTRGLCREELTLRSHILGTILQGMGHPFTLVPLHLKSVGSFKSGNATGQLGLVERGAVDTIFNNIVVTSERLEHFAFSPPVNYNRQAFLFAHRVSSGTEQIFDIFDRYFWALFGATVAAVAGTLLLGRSVLRQPQARPRLPDRLRDAASHLSLRVWQLAGMITGQEQEEAEEARGWLSRRLALGLFAVLSILVLSLFTSSLLSLLISERPIIPFTDPDHLTQRIRKKELTLIRSPSNSYFFSKLEGIQHLGHKDVGNFSQFEASLADRELMEALSVHPAKRRPERSGKFTKILEEEKGGVIPYTEQGALRLETSFCGIVAYIDEGGRPSVRSGFVFRKDSAFLAAFSEAVNRNVELLLEIEHLDRRRYLAKTKREICSKRSVGDALSLPQLYGIFRILGLGVVAGSAYLALELFRQRLSKAYFPSPGPSDSDRPTSSATERPETLAQSDAAERRKESQRPSSGMFRDYLAKRQLFPLPSLPYRHAT